MTSQEKIAKVLLEINAVGFVLTNPITFKSGIVSPVYVDNRRFPFFPKQWKTVITGFGRVISEKNIDFDIIAGIETAGIPHSATLGYTLMKPSVFIRKAAKDHGTKKLIEGGEVKGKRVILIEDHISTGGSSLHGVHALQDEGAKVVACLAITSYEFKEADDAFTKAKVPLYTLTTFSHICKEAVLKSKITKEEMKIVQAWMKNPYHWEKKGKL